MADKEGNIIAKDYGIGMEQLLENLFVVAFCSQFQKNFLPADPYALQFSQIAGSAEAFFRATVYKNRFQSMTPANCSGRLTNTTCDAPYP